MSTKKIIIIAVVIFLVIVISLVAVFALMYTKSKADKANEPKEKFYYNVGEIYCNVKDSSSIVKMNITVEVTDKELLKLLEMKKFLVNHQINEIVRSKVEEELEGSEGQTLLQKEITEKLAKLFNTKDITNIYFNELIVQ